MLVLTSTNLRLNLTQKARFGSPLLSPLSLSFLLSLTHALLSATREPISPLPFSNHQNLLFFSSVLFEEHAVSHFILPHPLSLPRPSTLSATLSKSPYPSLPLSLSHPIPLSIPIHSDLCLLSDAVSILSFSSHSLLSHHNTPHFHLYGA